MRELTLSVNDRIKLIGVIHTMKFDRLGATTLNSVLMAVNFSTEEQAEICMQATANNGLVWDAQKGVDKTFALTDEQVLILKKTMTILDDTKEMPVSILPLDTKISQL